MKTLPDGMQDHLDTGATTLSWCWKLTRSDGTVLGFTDHDADVTVDDVTYAAATGFTASEMASNVDYSVDNLEAAGAFNADSLTEDDMAAGLYDGAEVAIYRVNWADTSQCLLMRKGWLGEVTRGKIGFQAEIRGLMQALSQNHGRSYTYLCDADLGDDRCGIDLTSATYCGTGTVETVTDNRRFTVSGLDDFDSGWFTCGKLTWSSGNNNGLSIEIKRHTKTSASVTIAIWQTAAEDIAAGDTFSITAGCDKSFSTCCDTFSNGENHRGFPYMIGNDAVVAYAYNDTDLDGGSRYGN